MKFSRRTKVGAAVSCAASFALIATGCSSAGTGTSAGASPVELTVTTFGTMGMDALYAQYEASHPGITIKANNIDTGANAQTDAFTKIAAGSGLSDVLAVEEGWLGAIQNVSSQFTDLKAYGADSVKDRWVSWKVAQATDKDGRIIGYGTDIGPEGICYNSKAFAAAGLPTDRAAVATLLGGSGSTWDKYFAVGEQYQKATGKAWFDQSGFIWNSMVNQLPEGYYTKDGKLNVENNADLKSAWTKLAAANAAGLSAKQSQWDWNKGTSFTDGTFATFMCPGWMLGVVQGQVKTAGGDAVGATAGWDFADVFPGGAANWGGSFLTVPTQSKHPKEAAELATWLTDAKQEVAEFQTAGAFPSVTAAQTDPALAAGTGISAFFNDAPLASILSKRADGVKAQYKGPDDSTIQEKVFGPSTISLDQGASGDKAWSDAMTLFNQLIVNK
ncbi:ABC transporter substrate-binding protein [Cryobacterium sp. 10I5]|uniref:ABC transporter substrate-binding protein n=1 Tax=Cryobacterium sp. 10I5 TaxID=3048581 RepID=UPI002B22BA34|nr:ABC transporter substrate-binding protein [Cryobacterium sp. 10I5]MEB0266561.1 ABC transporter substrate-binding protein [Cryobacterium sp. 10I5]